MGWEAAGVSDKIALKLNIIHYKCLLGTTHTTLFNSDIVYFADEEIEV